MRQIIRRASLALFLFILPHALFAVSLPPDVALSKLVEGNRRFIEQQRVHPNQTETRRDAIIEKQTPFAAIMSCSDSRVPPEIIFDVGFGDVFISRVAGNVVGPIEMETLEYAIKKLNVQLIMVLGHENCGAVKATLEDPELAKNIPVIAGLIQPYIVEAKKQEGDCLKCAIKLNALGVRNQLLEFKDFKPFLESGKLKIVAGYYDLKTGEVFLLD